ncbi:MAG: RNA methyltransferase [Lachnospiraceae bacterium]|nr:RNA methyltransferase [Lachnospiraceae bacterium]
MITSKDNAQVKQVCAYQKKRKERDRDGVFVAEGERLVLEAPADALRTLYISVSYREKAKGDAERFLARHEAITEVVSDDVFRKMSDVETPQGILAVVRQGGQRLRHFVPPVCARADRRPPDALHRSAQSRRPPGEGECVKSLPALLLDNIQDSGNLGTIFRSAEAAGISFILLGADCADAYSPKVVRATMGSIFRVPFAYTEDLASDIRTLRWDEGMRVYAAMLDKEAAAYDSIDYTAGPVAFVIGNEAGGIRDEIAAACSGSVYIPMAGKNESLNAAVSASVLLFEAARQKRMRQV